MNTLGIPHCKFKFSALTLQYLKRRDLNNAHDYWLNMSFTKNLYLLDKQLFVTSIKLISKTHKRSWSEFKLCYVFCKLFRVIFQGACNTSSRTWWTKGFRPPKAVSCWCVMDLSALMDFQLCCIVCSTADNRKLRRQPCRVCLCDQHTWINTKF